MTCDDVIIDPGGDERTIGRDEVGIYNERKYGSADRFQSTDLSHTGGSEKKCPIFLTRVQACQSYSGR